MHSLKRFVRVDRSDIHYLQSTIEAYEGLAVMRTLDAHAGLVELLIAPGQETELANLLASLASREGVRLKKVQRE